MTNYDLIERAIIYLTENAHNQPSLDEVAKHVGLSPFHFQRLFQEWAGVSPKKFLQYMSVEQAKELLRQNNSLLDTSLEVGFSSSSRLHDLFVASEGMTPGNFKQGAAHLKLNYSFADTLFGKIVVGSTEKGLCYLAFCTSETDGLANLQRTFPKAEVTQAIDQFQAHALKVFAGETNNLSALKLHLKGTPFQLKVWSALLQLPPGSLCTYVDIACFIDLPKSSRAVGNAVGSNPIAYLIPCHRVIRSTGIIGGYRWGRARKQAMLGWEASQSQARKVHPTKS